MHNQGIDLSLNFNKRIGKDWMISAKGTFTFARNILDEVFETEAPSITRIVAEQDVPTEQCSDTMLWATLLMMISILTVP